MEKVKACPQCGLNYQEYCYHYSVSDGYKVESVETAPEEAIKILERHIWQLESDVESAKDNLNFYRRKIDGD